MMKIIFTLLLALSSLFSYSQSELTNNLQALYENKQYNEIIKVHSEKVQDYSAKEIYYVAMAYYMKSDDNNCLELINLSIEKDGKDSDAFYIKGMTLYYLQEFEKAIESFEKAIELDESISEYHSGLGDSYYKLGQLDKALISFKKATEKKNPIDRPFTVIPQIYASKKDAVNALKSFYIAKNNISKESSSYNTALFNIGLYEVLNKNYNKAEAPLKELIELDSNDFHAYSKLIQVYYGKREYDKAEPFKSKLYAAYKQGKLKDNLENMFCFDQFDWNDKLIQVFERFKEPKGELYYKHLFYVMNKKGEIEYRIQTENSTISQELGGPKYAVGMTRNETHSTFGFIEENFKYEDLKSFVLKILNEKIKPSASSRPGN